jgi:YkoY family integral membrane protein
MEFIGQTLQASDLLSIAVLVLLEGALSADNALVMAIMVRHLPRALQQKALLYGLGGAFVFRLIAILLASYVLQLWWLQLVGAAYLLYLPLKHFRDKAKHKGEDPSAKPLGKGFWPTVITVELTDIAFAIDSVLAGVSFVNNRQDKVWVVYFGAIIGIILLRFAAGGFIKVLERYPVLDNVAYALVGWVGVKLLMLSGNNMTETLNPGFTIPHMPTWLFWTVMTAIIVVGCFVAFRNPNEEPLSEDAAHAEELFSRKAKEPDPSNEG